jgi:serine/threonine protein kinase
MNKLIIDKYAILSNIGKGAFGDVFRASRISDNIDVAMKIEKKSFDSDKLLLEYEIYKKIHKSGFKCGTPKIYEFLQTMDYNILIMELLGNNLDDLFNRSNKVFSISTVLFLGINIIRLISELHKIGYVHRDIKPNNFLVGLKNNQKIYLTDFGLSKKYIINGHHIDESFNHGMVGTARYSSINMHMGFEPSRRDDLESIGYMLIYFAKGNLPWQGLPKDKKNFFDRIFDVKLSTKLNSLCGNLPKCFISYIEYCRSLKFNETPNYDYLIELFLDEITDKNYLCYYEWTH